MSSTFNQPRFWGLSLLASTMLMTPALAQDVLEAAPITVEAAALVDPATAIYDGAEAAEAAPYSDGASYLSTLPGVVAGRFGGHGLEVFLRGQSEGGLNIVSDDTYVFGGCPNRMDPPTAYISLQSDSEIEIVHGYQSVLNGFGGAGGSVIISEKRPDLGTDLTTTGLFQSGYDSNSQLWTIGANATSGTDQGYVKAYAAHKDADNYDDGDGKEVRSSFTEQSSGFKLGYTPADTHIYAGFDIHKVEDALFAGSGMDSPLSESKTFKAGLERAINGPVVKDIALSAYGTLVDHIMDNFSLRTLTAPSAQRVDSQSDTYGAKLESTLMLDGQEAQALLEWRRNNRNADRIINSTGVLQSLLWPDITIDEIAIAGETSYDLALDTRVIVGGRYDYVHVDYGRADTLAPAAAGGLTPNDVYTQFYGITASTQTEHNLGGLIRVEHDYTPQTLVYTGLSRSVRTADATERGLANYMGATSWVGNPDINPEKHHQLDVGFDTQAQEWAWGGSLYANIVQDYILRDSARDLGLQNADIYRNIDALLTGFEWHGSWQFQPDWTVTGDATYTFGQDLDAGRALPQIPPLQGTLGLDWQSLPSLKLGAKMRWAFQQTRVDTDPLTGTGRDTGKTPGYAVFDLEGTLTKVQPVTLNFGVTNLLDKTYASHLNRSSISDPTEIQVNEPGRSVYLKLSMPF